MDKIEIETTQEGINIRKITLMENCSINTLLFHLTPKEARQLIYDLQDALFEYHRLINEKIVKKALEQ